MHFFIFPHMSQELKVLKRTGDPLINHEAKRKKIEEKEVEEENTETTEEDQETEETETSIESPLEVPQTPTEERVVTPQEMCCIKCGTSSSFSQLGLDDVPVNWDWICQNCQRKDDESNQERIPEIQQTEE